MICKVAQALFSLPSSNVVSIACSLKSALSICRYWKPVTPYKSKVRFAKQWCMIMIES